MSEREGGREREGERERERERENGRKIIKHILCQHVQNVASIYWSTYH